MRNLKLLVSLEHSINPLGNSQQFTAGTLDYNRNIFQRKACYFVYKSGDVFTVNPINGTCQPIISLGDLHAGDVSPVALFFNSILNTLSVALEVGHIFTVTLSDDFKPIDSEIQLVGRIETGLQSAALSPDAETVVFLTRDNVVILMSGNFDTIEEIDLYGSDQGEQVMVNVGWGKKETQFHGSEGKSAAKKAITDETFNNLNVCLEANNRKPYITWRGDSTLFAISYWCPTKNYQKVKIFDKYGHLQCTSEYIPGLEEVLAWRPSGNLIALTQKQPNKHVICFMEKNGLRHGDFTLPLNIRVLELSWNSESTILSAVCIDELLHQPCILLWTTGNYHWYLKQKLVFTSSVVSLQWDEVIGNLVHILLADGTFLVYQWVWTTDHSAGITDDDLAVVAVIDGCDVKLSAFKKCIIPPPMCGATVSLPCPVLQLCFSPHISGVSELSPNDLCVYLSDGRLGIIRGMESSPQLQGIVPMKWNCPDLTGATPASFSHWIWLAKDQLVCTIHCGASYLCVLELSDQALTVMKTVLMEEPVLTITHQGGSLNAIIQLCSGNLLQYKDGELNPLISLPEPCISVQSLGSHIFARALNNHMYVDGELIASNVTSFYCLPRFLVMTLSSHQLSITSAEWDFKLQGDEKTNRRLERGSRLVVCVGHSVVLQMPRGNLETVEPRALTLVTAGKFLDSGDFGKVAQLLRRQRINLNLCVDHNPTQFLLSVSKFVIQVQDPQWLSVFLAELSEQDVTRTMYAGFYQNQAGRGPPLADKIKRVCSSLREAMSQSEEDKIRYQQPILSSLVREGRLGEAITLADSEQALNYLILLMDVDKLYNEALGAYNLDKALKIAGKSLKDPKEYIAYLNELRGMEAAYMRFTIDKSLRKPESALHNIAQCKDRDQECLLFIQETGLYNLALKLFKERTEMYKQVCLLYGEWLLKHQKHQEAGLMLTRGGDLKGAIAAYNRAGCWRQCLSVAEQHSLSASDVEELQQTLYSALVNRQQFAEAAQMCDQLHWYDKAVSCFVDAHLWDQATYLSYKHRLTNMLESTVKPALIESQNRILGDLRSKREDLERYAARLQIVRERKANPDNNFDAMSDIQSDTSSLSSFSTSSAGTRTTKNTRKAQRKLWSLKEGNPREEQALLHTITELIQNTERLTGEVRSTCLALGEFSLDEEASTLQSTMISALDQITRVKQTVWPAYTIKKSGSDADAIDPTAIDTQLSFPPTSCLAASWKLNIYS